MLSLVYTDDNTLMRNLQTADVLAEEGRFCYYYTDNAVFYAFNTVQNNEDAAKGF